VVSNEMLKEIGYRLGHEINLFVTHTRDEWGGPLVASSEPGIFATGILSERLPGTAWRETVLLSREFVSATERIGEYAFQVGYSPIVAASGEALGVLSIPMIYGQDAVDRELARRNSLILALYLLILLVVIFIGMILARRISSPIERLAEATRRLSAGDLDYRIPHHSRDEFGHLVDSFNRMTEDLRRSRETIVRAEKDAAWREMAKQIAHEIKNPLTPMRLSAQQVLRAYEDDHEDFVEIFTRGLETIIRQTESLRRIASEFSAFARLPARQMKPVDAAALVREVAGLYSGTENVTVVEKIAAVPPVIADREELWRVIVNLAANAVQAMERDGGTLTVGTAATDGGVEISVTDTGVGIPAEDMTKLFVPNFSTKTGGTGLGLAISKAVVETCGGAIEVSSEVGRGTVVRVVLPAADPETERTSEAPET
ncbi:MAG: ATP-binding protein, partial [Planctomycetota bacterium]